MKTFLELPALSEGESIDRSMASPDNEPEMQSFDFPFVISLDKLLNK